MSGLLIPRTPVPFRCRAMSAVLSLMPLPDALAELELASAMLLLAG